MNNHRTIVRMIATAVVVLACAVEVHAQLPVRTRDLRLFSNNNVNYVSHTAPNGLLTNTVYTWPTALPSTNGQVLSGTTGGQLSWITLGNFWALGGNAVPSEQTLGTTSTFDLPIITNNVERMRILSTGEVGIGATPAAARLLDVNGTAGTANVRLRSTGGAAIATVYTPTANDGIIVSDVNGDLVKRSVSSVLGGTPWLLGGNAVTSAQNLGTTSTFDLPIITNNVERMRILSTGEVGIGATPAASRLLDVNGTAGTANVRLRSTSGAAIATAYTPTANDGIIVADANGDLLKRSVGSVIGSTAWLLGGNAVAGLQNFGTTSTFDLPIITNNVERMRILSTGEVGIGATPTAARLLDVNGTAGTANVRLRSTGGAAIATAYTPTANDGIIVSDANGDLLKRSVGSVLGSTAWLLGGNAVTSVQNLGTTSTFDLPIITNNVERMRILSTGEVGIGATPTAARLLDVNGTAGTANVRLRSTGGAAIATAYAPTANDGIIVADANGDLLKRSVGSVLGSTAWLLGGNAVTSVQNLGTTSAFALPIITNGAERVRILSTGEVGIGTPTPTANARLTIATIPATGGRGIDVDMTSTTTSSGLVVRGIGASGANDAGILVGTATAGTGIGMRVGTVAGFNAPDLGIDIQAASNGVIVTPTTAGTGTAFRASTSAGTRGRRAFEGFVRGTAGNVAYGLSSDANAIAGGTGLGAYLSTSGTTGTLYPLVVASENNRNIYLGSTTADTPADLATVLTGTSNQSTTYMFNARMSGGATLVGSTSGTATFVAPATIATSHTYTMPSATGAAGQVLRIATTPAPTAAAATLEWGPATGSEIFEEVTAGQGNVRRKLAYTNGIAGAPVGQYAIDLQAARGAATQTASGQYSALVGGSSNTVSGAYAFIGAGLSNTASNSYASVLGGQANSVSGTHATILGGQSNTVSGNHSMAFGYGAAVTQNNSIVFNHPTVGAGATRVGIGNNNPTVSLDVDGGVVIRPPANVAVAGNNQTVTVGNRSYIVLDPGGADRTGLILSAGSNAGQILILRILETAGNYIQLPDAAGSGVNLTGNWTGRADDTIMLIWTGANWAETSRSNN